VDARSVGNIADNLSGIGVDDNGMSTVRHVKTTALTIDFEIVPAPFSSDFDLLNDVVTGCSAKHRERGGSKQYSQRNYFPHGPSCLVVEQVNIISTIEK
jgi:hypothetical protein